ncbi:MAG: metallopeptidase family protein [Chloroflexi bacterium]|nr:metallopeptidase family protein [Chloroflexota bacterium]
MFKEKLDNVGVVIQDWPTAEQRETAGVEDDEDLLGLYEGVPLTERTTNYNMVLPDKITVFRKPLLGLGLSDWDLEEEIIETVRHELAHHFGIDDERLEYLQGQREEFKD